MAKHEPFRFKSAEDLLSKAEKLGINLPWQESLDPLFTSFRIKEKVIPNRLVVHPMEGFDANQDGSPGELAFRRYNRYAKGGSGMIWFEATAILKEGKSNPGQLVMNNQTLPGFQKLVEDVRTTARETYGDNHNPYLVLQLTHSGRFCKPEGSPVPVIFNHNPYLKPEIKDVKVLKDEEIQQLGEKFVKAAVLAEKAGFDSVDIKASHGYLLHEFLSSFIKKNSMYGGSSLANRIRLILWIIRQIQDRTTQLNISSRINLYDGIPFPYGFGVKQDGSLLMDLDEPINLVKELKQAGCYLINGTMGIPVLNSNINRPFDRALPGSEIPDEHPLEGVSRLIDAVGDIQQAVPDIQLVGTGYSWLRNYLPHVAAAVLQQKKATFIGLGRSSFAYPDAPKDLMLFGEMRKEKTCITCSKCTEMMRHLLVTGCPVRDKKIYDPVYQKILIRD